MRALPVPAGTREPELRDHGMVTVAPGRRRPLDLSRVNPDGSVDRATQDGWVRVSGPARPGERPQLVAIPAEEIG